jgi:hypothetical protein
MTQLEVDALNLQRNELSSQLRAEEGRRRSLARDYQRADGAAREGLDARLRVSDARIMQLERSIASIDQQLGTLEAARVMAIPRLGTPVVPPRPTRPNSAQITAVAVVFTLAVLFPLALSMARLLWRRASHPVMPSGWSEATLRLERVEHAVDTIAIEIERISEAQRFMTRIMTERPAATPGSGAEPARALGEAQQPLPALGSGSPDQLFAQKSVDEALRVRRS